MRPSNRSRILDAAIRVVHREGVTGITFESVAAESGLTRGGLLYHFPSRDALLLGVHQHLASAWEATLTAAAGKPAHEASPQERLAAYVRTSADQGASRVELQLMLEGVTNPTLAAPWEAVLERWLPDGHADEAVLATQWLVRLAADGLWAYDSLSNRPLPPALRARISQTLLAMVAPKPAHTSASRRSSSRLRATPQR